MTAHDLQWPSTQIYSSLLKTVELLFWIGNIQSLKEEGNRYRHCNSFVGAHKTNDSAITESLLYLVGRTRNVPNHSRTSGQSESTQQTGDPSRRLIDV